jgi:hypothetical protein
MIEPGYAQGVFAPARIALLPPDVFVVLDQVGDNDPVASAALGQEVSAGTVRAVEHLLRSRGYDVNLAARWDGIYGRDGSLLVNRDELGGLANGILAFANSEAGGGEGVMTQPYVVAPELASRVGWATQSDAVLYVNVKGAVTSSGKRAASIFAAVFIVFIVVAIVLIATQSKGGGGGSPTSGGGGGQPVARAGGGSWRGGPSAGGGSVGGGGWRGGPAIGGGGAALGGGGGWRGAPGAGAGAVGGGAAVGGGGWRGNTAGGGAPASGGGWRGRGTPPPVPRGAPVYRGGGGGVHVGVGVFVPLNGPTHTHSGEVAYDDPLFAGDEVYVSMTMVSTYDGRVLWHAREHLDVEANRPEEIARMVEAFVGTLPPAKPAAR